MNQQAGSTLDIVVVPACGSSVGCPAWVCSSDPLERERLSRAMAWKGWQMTCCSNEQVQFIIGYCCFAIACLLLWRSRLLLPLKLFTTFLHEFGHATAAWLTCSKVQGIEVHRDQGGLTTWSSTRPQCASFFVLPAGYIASAMWAALIVVCSSDRLSAVVIALVLCVFMMITLLYQACGKLKQPEITLTVLLVCLITLLVGLVVVELGTTWLGREVPLRVVLLLIGVMNSLFATYDIYTDCIRVDNPRSDAHKLAEAIPCCCSRFVGVVWFVIGIAFVGFAAWLTLLLEASDEQDRVGSLEDIEIMTLVAIAIGMGTLAAAILWRCICAK